MGYLKNWAPHQVQVGYGHPLPPCLFQRYLHGHHLDRRYDQVILNLVWHQVDEKDIITSQNRKVINYPLPNIVLQSKDQLIQNCRQPGHFNHSMPLTTIKHLAFQRLRLKLLDIKNRVLSDNY